MIDVPTEGFSTIVQLLIWIGSAIISSMAIAIVVLWRANESKNSYIIDQDKANRTLYFEILNNNKFIGSDVSKIIGSLDKINSSTSDLREKVIQFINSHKK